MPASTPKSVFWRAFRHGLPFMLVVAPFAMLFGVVATEAGLPLLETMGFSVLVIAGAAQFAALQQMVDGAPTLVVLATAFAVNLRMGMYSAALVPHLGPAPLWQRALVAYLNFDQTYAMSMLEYERRPEAPAAEKVAYFLGVAFPTATSWFASTAIGALLGSRIPEGAGLDFALPVTFLAMIGPMLRTPAHVAAALVSVAAALAFMWMPYNLGLLIAAALAMVTGAQVELWSERRAK